MKKEEQLINKVKHLLKRAGAPVRLHRLRLKKTFPKKIFGKINIVESFFHAFRTKYGSSVSAKKISCARTEVYCKAILHNIFLKIIRLLGQTPCTKKH